MEKNDRKQSEYQLIEDILDGDRDSYRIIVERYSSMIFHIVRRFEKDEDEVKELAQQIFVKAFEKLDSFNKRSKFSSWLYSLALNHCRDFAKNIRRNNQRFSDLEEDFLENAMSDPGRTPYRDLEAADLNRALKQAIGELNNNYMDPFLMKYRDGMSYEAMSERLGVGVSALKVRVHRARKELKTLIENRM